MVYVADDVPHADKRLRMHERLFQDAQKPEISPEGEEEVLSADKAQKLGSAMQDEPLWVFGGEGKPMCKLVPREPILVHRNTGPTYSRLERALDGECAAIAAGEPRIAVQQADAPKGCEFFRATPSKDEKAKALLPQKACAFPECEAFSRVRSAVGKGHAALEITSTFLYPTAEPECSWKREDSFQILWGDEGLRKLQRIEDNLDLFGVLIAENNPSIVITYEPGIMRFFEVSSEHGPQQAGRIETDVLVEGQAVHTLGPDCGP